MRTEVQREAEQTQIFPVLSPLLDFIYLEEGSLGHIWSYLVLTPDSVLLALS